MDIFDFFSALNIKIDLNQMFSFIGGALFGGSKKSTRSHSRKSHRGGSAKKVNHRGGSKKVNHRGGDSGAMVKKMMNHKGGSAKKVNHRGGSKKSSRRSHKGGFVRSGSEVNKVRK